MDVSVWLALSPHVLFCFLFFHPALYFWNVYSCPYLHLFHFFHLPHGVSASQYRAHLSPFLSHWPSDDHLCGFQLPTMNSAMASTRAQEVGSPGLRRAPSSCEDARLLSSVTVAVHTLTHSAREFLIWRIIFLSLNTKHCSKLGARWYLVIFVFNLLIICKILHVSFHSFSQEVSPYVNYSCTRNFCFQIWCLQ